MLLLISAVIVAAAVLVAGRWIATSAPRPAGDRVEADALAVMQLLAPGVAAVQQDPRALLVWQPLAHAARQLHPAAFAALDRAYGAAFPFSTAQIQAAHAQWTADWLTWERSHDAEFRLKAAVAEEQVAAGGSPAARARLEAVDREKLEVYQRRYQEYVRVSKALQALSERI